MTQTLKTIEENPARGEEIQTTGGAVGRYVGSLPGGSVWVCYEAETYTQMCETFDRMAAK